MKIFSWGGLHLHGKKCWYMSRHGAEEVAERFTSCAGNRKWSETLSGILSIYETSNPASTVTHFLQQDHIYSNKAIFLIVPFPLGDIFLQILRDCNL